MIFTVKLDKDNYFLDKETGEIVESYDSSNKNLQLRLKLNDSILIVDNDSIIQEYGGQISVQHLDNKYIIDDGYQDVLVKCGYIVYKNYDTERITNVSYGVDLRESLLDKIKTTMETLYKDFEINTSANEVLLSTISGNYSYKFRFNTISDIVTKNYKRKDNSLTYYPFDKSMDKYGAIHVSIFVQKLGKGDDINKYDIPNETIKNLVKELGLEYHYVALPIKGRVLYWPGL